MDSTRSESRATQRSATRVAWEALLLCGVLVASAFLLRFAWRGPAPTVLYPRLGRPAVLLPGEAFPVALEGGIAIDGVRLRGAAVVDLERAAPAADASEASRWSVPPSLAPGKYDLIVSYGQRRTERAGSVHVRARYPETWRIAQIADLPKLGGGKRGLEAMAELVAELNFRNPDLILISGDIAYVGGEDGYRSTYEWLSRLDPPIVVAVGNHEHKDRRLYQQYWGASTHAVDVGDLRVISLDSRHGRDELTESQFHWLAQTLRTKGDRTAIVHLHHPVFGSRSIANRARSFADLMEECQVPIVLSGHTHGDRIHDRTGRVRTDTWAFPGTKYVTSAPAGADYRPAFSDSQVERGYRLFSLRGGELLGYTYDWDGDGAPDPVSSWPVGHLRFERPDDRTILVTNDLNDDVQDAVVTFLEPAGAPPLVPSPSARFDVVSSSDGDRYRVHVDVPARSTRRFELVPTP